MLIPVFIDNSFTRTSCNDNSALRKSLKKALLSRAEADGIRLLHKRIAILGGSTTHDIREILELFLLDEGIAPEFYESEYAHFEAMWRKITETYGCPIIQNNFEQPFYRLLGNRDAWDVRGKCNFVSRLNQKLYERRAAVR